MLGAPDGQAVERVVVDHGGHVGEGFAELPQDERLPRCGRGGRPLDPHVHETAGRSVMREVHDEGC